MPVLFKCSGEKNVRYGKPFVILIREYQNPSLYNTIISSYLLIKNLTVSWYKNTIKNLDFLYYIVYCH